MPQAMKIPAAKAEVDKEWEKLEMIPAWDLTKVRSKSEVIDEAWTKGRKVHFASLMDICHLKNAELETKHQKYKGRVVLRGDIVKDVFVSYAVFTEHGSSAAQMTAGSHGCHIQTATVRRTSSWPVRWGPQGMAATGGGGLVRVPNLRVCKHLLWGGGTRRRATCRGTVQSARQYFQ